MSGCPSGDCYEEDAVQRQLKAGEAQAIGAADWLRGAQICSGCGCVYTANDDDTFTVRGYVDHSSTHRPWRPVGA
jgi:hypothetical protein